MSAVMPFSINRGMAPWFFEAPLYRLRISVPSLPGPVFFAGLIFSLRPLLTAGIVLFSLAVLFQLVTLPVEINASRRAVSVLNSTGMVTQEESSGVKKVLTAAALTYVAALASSILQLLRLIILAGGRRRDD